MGRHHALLLHLLVVLLLLLHLLLMQSLLLLHLLCIVLTELDLTGCEVVQPLHQAVTQWTLYLHKRRKESVNNCP